MGSAEWLGEEGFGIYPKWDGGGVKILTRFWKLNMELEVNHTNWSRIRRLRKEGERRIRDIEV